MTNRLRWSEVSSEQRHFDEERARKILETYFRSTGYLSLNEPEGYYVDCCVDQLLVQEFGPWLCGWRSGENGGPILTELLLDEPNNQNVENVLSAVREWLEFLEEIDLVFEEFSIAQNTCLETNIEKVTSRIVPMVLRRTDAQDAWYSTCSLAINWYLDSVGCGDRFTRLAVNRALSGQFDSWIEPGPRQLEEAARQVQSAFVQSAAVDEDALEDWLSVREPPEKHWTHFCRPHQPLRTDGHTLYIIRREGDPRMLKGLEAARNWAEGKELLTLSVLKGWQKLILNQDDLQLRTTDAFAKNGRERYGLEHLPSLESYLEGANDESLSPQWRASMAYLDICFFHPFPDGNARLARLVLDAILWRAGFALNYVEPAFTVARAAADDRGGTCLAIVVDQLLGIRSNSGRSSP